MNDHSIIVAVDWLLLHNCAEENAVFLELGRAIPAKNALLCEHEWNSSIATTQYDQLGCSIRFACCAPSRRLTYTRMHLYSKEFSIKKVCDYL